MPSRLSRGARRHRVSAELVGPEGMDGGGEWTHMTPPTHRLNYYSSNVRCRPWSNREPASESPPPVGGCVAACRPVQEPSRRSRERRRPSEDGGPDGIVPRLSEDSGGSIRPSGRTERWGAVFLADQSYSRSPYNATPFPVQPICLGATGRHRLLAGVPCRRSVGSSVRVRRG